MMRFKNMLNLFSKTEVQDDERFSLAPMREREELLCERSELSNSGEGYISSAKHTVTVFSPFTSHFSQLYTPHPSPLPQGAREELSCAKHTEKNLLSYSPIHLFTFKKVAFTLAEVLITLAIIGVVAALTLPTLISNHQKQAYVTGLKKAYANLQNVFAKMAYDEGVTEWKQTSCFNMGLYDCGMELSQDDLSYDVCVANLQKQMKIIEYNDDFLIVDSHDGQLGSFVTEDGILYTLMFGNIVATNPQAQIQYVMGLSSISVDVNGNKGPNKMGRDRFRFDVDWDKNKINPYGLGDYNTYCTTANVKSDSWEAETCTAKVLIEGKMDY